MKPPDNEKLTSVLAGRSVSRKVEHLFRGVLCSLGAFILASFLLFSFNEK